MEPFVEVPSCGRLFLVYALIDERCDHAMPKCPVHVRAVIKQASRYETRIPDETACRAFCSALLMNSKHCSLTVSLGGGDEGDVALGLVICTHKERRVLVYTENEECRGMHNTAKCVVLEVSTGRPTHKHTPLALCRVCTSPLPFRL